MDRIDQGGPKLTKIDQNATLIWLNKIVTIINNILHLLDFIQNIDGLYK